ncbi:3-hydroxyisobutyrate dehydrogenase [Nocardioides sp. Root1257]|uniref:3-hydroxyisobutyrate dehydrogenase n=1 Tax=unclassified Nocardioides TaxID=2615069 RepID=UPI0006F2AA25|nr:MULTISPECIES: 3-hydroxyisobutyrate dehydrogenase [unclassified Nocardioides]KQW45015.1 3-hydroxyisobutyrate dehydrogenase [Nocardioides sp. Root1257]KRC45981.1 3-hydroxyisobutyrate dehydrogenase [Nocardioides sp. Root224]
MTTTTPTKVAFIGLGNMGGPMAANLVKAGYAVAGFDPSPAAVDLAREHGIALAGSAADAAADADVVFTMLPTGSHVLDVYLGRRGNAPLLGAAPARALLVDCSTIAVQDAREAAQAALAAGYRAVDAPVSGGVVGAAAGTLTFMVGATDADLDEVRVLLEPMAGRVVHCGENGAGQAAKICNNMILGISMIAVSEAFVLGERLGLTHQALFDVASTASGQCWALTTNCPVPGPVPTSPANRDYAPGFASPLMAKDLALAMKAADTTLTDARLGQLATDIYRQFADGDGRGLDFSAIVATIREEPVEALHKEEVTA